MQLKNAWLIIILCLTGCSSFLVPGLLDTEKSYPYDLEMEINGKKYKGIAVVDEAPKYEMKLMGKGSMAFFYISNCHRTVRSSEINGSGWFLWKGKPTYGWTYEPNEIESESVCPLEISALDRKGGKHSFGYVDFRRKAFSLPATIVCSGKKSFEVGVSVCNESKALEQGLSFSQPVEYEASPKCSALETLDGMNFRYRMPDAKCQYGFMNNKYETHRHVALGFSQIIYPEAEEKDE